MKNKITHISGKLESTSPLTIKVKGKTYIITDPNQLFEGVVNEELIALEDQELKDQNKQ